MNPKSKAIKDFLIYGKAFLKDKGIDSYNIDSEILLMYVTGFSKIQLFTKDDYELSEKEADLYISLLSERAGLKPIQYITGRCEFMGLEFSVNESTLIPRADTENLVERLIEKINKNGFKKILDIGTGSGAIAVAVAKYCGDVAVTAVDIDENALKTAEINAKRNGVLGKIKFVCSDLFLGLNEECYDVIVSNPPYICTDIIKTLSPQVKDFEPLKALDGGTDGLKFYREIISASRRFLNKNGMLFFEIGYDQGEALKKLLADGGYTETELHKDLAGLDRVVFGINKGE